MSKLWLIRHGPTHAKTMVGWTDVPADLSDLDHVARTRAALPNVPVVSSDLLRARRTADLLAEDRPRLPHRRALREMHFGSWENMTWAQAERKNPEVAKTLWSEPGDIAPPHGESWHALRTRVVAAIDEIARHGDAIIVAHFGVILTALQYSGQWNNQDTLSHKIDPLSVSEVQWGRSIIAINQFF